jgi:hypothetical protein
MGDIDGPLLLFLHACPLEGVCDTGDRIRLGSATVVGRFYGTTNGVYTDHTTMTESEAVAEFGDEFRDERLYERFREWNRTTGVGDIERNLSESGQITYRYVDDGTVIVEHRPMEVPRPDVCDAELDAWRVGTTGLSPEEADRLWQWYNDVYETTLVNDNRARGVRAFLERGVLFPWRTATCGRHRHDRARSALPEEWAEWAIGVGVTHADVNRRDLLVGRQGSADVPRPANR